MSKKALLIITDGIGHNPDIYYNAFANASKPTYDYLFANVPNSKIATSGLSVGLPTGQMGNSEVGHSVLGSGRIIYQDLVKIDKAVKDNSISTNEALQGVSKQAKNIHLVGLCSDGGVHSHISHIITLAQILSKKHKIYIHLITDGRDVPPNSAMRYIKQIQDICNDTIQIASVGGRFYAMDRDNNFDRVKKSFDVIYDGKNNTNTSIEEYVKTSYDSGVFDEFLEPISIGNYSGIQDEDGIIICNFRSDRAREITQALCDSDFSHFDRVNKKLYIATMTKYKDDFIHPIMFHKDEIKNTLAQVISNQKLRQFHTAETEKYAHVTFFFNGGVEKPYEGEEHSLVSSPKVKTYDMKPEMSADGVCDKVLGAMDDDYDFIVVNFANGDMVGHTGNYEAAIKAIESVDKQLGRIINSKKAKDYKILITSDHGNCEKMREENGDILTNHTTEDVYGFCIAEGVDKLSDGGLNNVAPTILKLMDIDIPKEMDKPLVK